MMRAIPWLAVLAALSSLPSPAAAQSPWAKVPRLPAACYAKGDTFDADVERAHVEIDNAIKAQLAVNDAVLKRLGEVDPAAQQARMMAYMRKDPAAAQKYMEDISNMAATQQVAVRVAEKRQALDERLQALQAQYVTDAAPLTPLYKRFQDAMTPGPGTALYARLPEHAAAYDAAYEKFCPKWWGAASPFVGYLGEFKNMLVKDAIPYGDEMARAQKTQFDVMGIPATGYKSTAEMEAVKEYLEAARKIYKQRPATPLKEL